VAELREWVRKVIENRLVVVEVGEGEENKKLYK